MAKNKVMAIINERKAEETYSVDNMWSIVVLDYRTGTKKEVMNRIYDFESAKAQAKKFTDRIKGCEFFAVKSTDVTSFMNAVVPLPMAA